MKHVFLENGDQLYKLTVSKVIGAGKADTEIIVNALLQLMIIRVSPSLQWFFVVVKHSYLSVVPQLLYIT